MLRKMFGRDAVSWNQAEEDAVNRLVDKHHRLIVDNGRVNTKSEAGYNACQTFLEQLATAAGTMLRTDKASRAYRSAFTINYRALFPDESWAYRVDVFEASAEQHSVIWVNGDKFEFSAEAMRRAEKLQERWQELDAILRRWKQASEHSRTSNVRPTRSELQQTLSKLDMAWANFEQKYITELIEIEEKARRLVVQAIQHEHSLQRLESRVHGGECCEDVQQMPEYREEQKCLVRCIAHLNSVANQRRKGRDDLGVDILSRAVTTLQRCDAAERGSGSTDASNAARILATDVVNSFEAMRGYLREVERCLEQVDPHLCNNEGLVTRLVDWEESWEVGTRYVRHEQLLDAICELVAGVRAAQRLVPSLKAMCEECDVELFLVLPRILWLHFLWRPERYMDLLKSLLPHRFPEPKAPSLLPHCFPEPKAPSVGKHWDAELEGFIEQFRFVRELLVSTQPSSDLGSGDIKSVAWEVLVKRVAAGAGAEDLYGCFPPRVQARAQSAVEDLMHGLEWWSMELQRHCPEDWNQCSAILLQCLNGGIPKPKDVPFHV